MKNFGDHKRCCGNEPKKTADYSKNRANHSHIAGYSVKEKPKLRAMSA
jgi:hypothetical protein